MTAMTSVSGMNWRRGRVLARGLLVVLALALLPLAAVLQTPRPGAAQAVAPDSLWAGWAASGYPASAAVCANPSSATSNGSCLGAIDLQGVTVQAMATDGVNVYYAGSNGGLSCPIADLGANCTHIMAGPWGCDEANNCYDNECYSNTGWVGPVCGVLSLAASGGQLWIGQSNGKIFRCPANLPYTAQVDQPASCVLLDDAEERSIDSLLLANKTLYAGLGMTGTRYNKRGNGLLWSCDPQTANSCINLDNYGATTANSLAAGGNYLWAGLQNGIIWRCDLNAKDNCTDWADAGTLQPVAQDVVSISYDGQGTIYAALGVVYTDNDDLYKNGGGLWACPTATADSCTGFNRSATFPVAVSANAGNLASSLSSGTLTFNSQPIASGQYGGYNSWLLYIPPGGPVGVGGVSVQVKSAGALGGKLTKRCKAG
ncbi:MAG: hypothetical protein ACR2J8_07930 [Thermomicrobiales bacterium]